MRIRRRAATENVGFNMTPMIDIVFQLITFFMLVTDMSQRELEQIDLPTARRAEIEEGGQPDRIFINIYHERSVACPDFDADQQAGPPGAMGEGVQVCHAPGHWRVSMKGKEMDRDTLLTELAYEAQQKLDPNDKAVSLRTVQIRGDRSAPFEEVREVLATLAKVGIRHVEFGATIPAEH